MSIRKRSRKLYEVSHDVVTDTHIIIPEGFGDISKKELESMENTVMKNRDKRRAAVEKIREQAEREQQILADLDNERKPWKTQRDKFKNGAVSEQIVVEDGVSPPREKKGGCKTCAAKGLKRLITGSAKLLKAELGIDGVSDEVYEERKKICLGCEEYDFGVCKNCSCFLSAKCKIGNESCPINKWSAIDGK
jgi:hypothetical protein